MIDAIYREVAATADLAGQVQALWYRQIGLDEASRPVRVMPDGCIDLIWMQGELIVAGPDTTAWVGQLPAGTELAGLRFRPGAARPVLGVPVTELVNGRLAASVVWGPRAAVLVDRLAAARSVAAASFVLQEAVRQQLSEASAIDRVVQCVVNTMWRTGGYPRLRIDRLAERVGLSERQLHRRCLGALGYGPKTLARIVRFQRFIEHARGQAPVSLAQLAAEIGYADQPHLTREVRRLAGLTPGELMADLVRR